MVIELSNLTFTEQDDVVPASGEVQILNTFVTNTLAGNDQIWGRGNDYGFKNLGLLNTDNGNDIIGGSVQENNSGGYGIYNMGTLNAGEGNDLITGNAYTRRGLNNGIYNIGTLNAGEGNDTISAFANQDGLINYGTLDTEDGNDIITVSGLYYGLINEGATLNTGEGNDIITASGFFEIGILNIFESTINTGNGDDSIIISAGGFINGGGVFLGEGNDSLIANGSRSDPNYFPESRSLENYNVIDTGDGNDIITSTYVIYNEGIINTGNGDDSIIVDGGGFDDITGTTYGIHNNGGAINMGDGNDSIIANEGFKSGPNNSGAWFLGEGEDYIKGFGSGDFYGGNGFDTLELTPGTYTVGIWGEGDKSVIFTKGNSLMITSEFERLIAGGTIYDFSSLTAGQIITVA